MILSSMAARSRLRATTTSSPPPYSYVDGSASEQLDLGSSGLSLVPESPPPSPTARVENPAAYQNGGAAAASARGALTVLEL